MSTCDSLGQPFRSRCANLGQADVGDMTALLIFTDPLSPCNNRSNNDDNTSIVVPIVTVKDDNGDNSNDDDNDNDDADVHRSPQPLQQE